MKSFAEALLRPGILRLVLAATVVLHHAGIFALGEWAVYVFFVLSGYWVCRMWWEKYRQRTHPFPIFIVSRYWRLWPAFFVCQLISVAVLARFSPRWLSEAALMSHPLWILRTFAIVSSGSQFNLNAPIWTLDIEMQFYLVLPALAWLLAKVFELPHKVRNALLVPVVAGLGALFIHTAFVRTETTLLPPFLLFFSLGMITFFSDWKPTRRVGLGSVGVVAAVFGVIVCNTTWRQFIGPDATRTALSHLHAGNLLIAGSLAVLFTPYAAYTVSLPSPRLDRHFGNISYVLYLFHYPVQMAMNWAGPSLSTSPTVRAILQVVAVVGGTVALYRLVDQPSEHWRHAILEKRRALPPVENSIHP